VILLSAGILLLLNNLDVLPWSIWQGLWPFWPLLLVLLGIEAFMTGRVAWGTLVMVIVLLPLIWLGVSIATLTGNWSDATSDAPDRLTSTLHQTLDGATSASVQIEYGVGAFDVGALPQNGGDILADGQVFGHGAARFTSRYDVRDGRGTLRISSSHGAGPPNVGLNMDAGRVDLRLNRAIPLDLQVDAGAADTTLNLADLQVSNLNVQTGASRGRIVFPAHGQTNARIEGGAAAMTLEIPDGVAARIMVDDGPNTVQIDQARFPKSGGEYRSPNFDTAVDKVTVRLSMGASRIVVQ